MTIALAIFAGCSIGLCLIAYHRERLFSAFIAWLTRDFVAVGFEDEDGFHYGSPNPSHRHPTNDRNTDLGERAGGGVVNGHATVNSAEAQQDHG
jgi:hypothetical protein